MQTGQAGQGCPERCYRTKRGNSQPMVWSPSHWNAGLCAHEAVGVAPG